MYLRVTGKSSAGDSGCAGDRSDAATVISTGWPDTTESLSVLNDNSTGPGPKQYTRPVYQMFER